MKNNRKAEVWPTMVTPFKDDLTIDYEALEKLVEWYIERGVSGLFAVCQSSEMHQLSLRERVELSSGVMKFTTGRVPVISSGHISNSSEDQIEEIKAIAKTGVDAVILVTNLLAGESESDSVWKKRMEAILLEIPEDLRLGLYECPYPYKRILSNGPHVFACGGIRCCQRPIRPNSSVSRYSVARLHPMSGPPANDSFLPLVLRKRASVGG